MSHQHHHTDEDTTSTHNNENVMSSTTSGTNTGCLISPVSQHPESGTSIVYNNTADIVKSNGQNTSNSNGGEETVTIINTNTNNNNTKGITTSTTKTPETKKKTTFATTFDKQTKNNLIEDTKSESAFSSGKSSITSLTRLKIYTCCGVVKLNSVRILSLVGMFVNILAFIAIAAVVINAFTLQSTVETDLLLWRGDLLQASEKVKCVVQLMVYENRTNLESYMIFEQNVTNLLTYIRRELPTDLWTLTQNTTEAPTMKTDRIIVDLVARAQTEKARILLESTDYSKLRLEWDSFLERVLDYSSARAFSKNSYLFVSSAVNLAVVIVGLVVVVPIVLVIFAMAIKKEGASSKKLKKATTFMLMDTMENSKQKEQFREFCSVEGGLEIFTFIEKTIEYSELCHLSEEEQEELVHLQKQHKKSTTNTKEEQEQLYKILELEKTKYRLAFEMYSDYLDGDIGEFPLVVSGDIHDKVRNCIDAFTITQKETHLPFNLFEEMQREVSMAHLTDVHYRFKQFILMNKKNSALSVNVQK